MPLTPEERKKHLGFGGLAKIAKRRRRTLGHVSQVNSEKRFDGKIRADITAAIQQRHPERELSHDAIWPTWPEERVVAGIENRSGEGSAKADRAGVA